jgi:hypothetical protein
VKTAATANMTAPRCFSFNMTENSFWSPSRRTPVTSLVPLQTRSVDDHSEPGGLIGFLVLTPRNLVVDAAQKCHAPAAREARVF